MLSCHSRLRSESSTTTALILVTFLCMCAIESTKVYAEYTLSLGAGNLTVHGNQLANGSCCEDIGMSANCSSPCTNTRLKICLQESDSTQDNCSLWETVVNITAEVDSLSEFTSPIIRSTRPANTTIQLLLLLYKTENHTPSQQLLIDTFSINPNLTVNQLQPSIMKIEGELGVATLSLSLVVFCAENYYGPDCDVYCRETSHYSCNETDGSIVCVDGYKNETLNCTQCVPALGCSEVGGYCDLPGECSCYPGYSGASCEIGPTVTVSRTFASVSPTSPTQSTSLSLTPTHVNSTHYTIIVDPSSRPVPTLVTTIMTSLVTTNQTTRLLFSLTHLTPSISSVLITTTMDRTVMLTQNDSIIHVTALVTPSMTTTGGGTLGRDHSPVIAGAVIGTLIALLLLAIGVALTVTLLMRRTQLRDSCNSAFSTNTKPRSGRGEKVTFSTKNDDSLPSVRMRTMTPDFLVVRRHNQHKTTVPNGVGNPLSTSSLDNKPSTPVKVDDSAELHRWFDEPEFPLSADDATLPRNIRSPSADTDSTQARGDVSTAASTLSRPADLKVYQMPSFENDSIIYANPDVEDQVVDVHGQVTGKDSSENKELMNTEQMKKNSKSL